MLAGRGFFLGMLGMAKFWNFVIFQFGWFACVLGAANKQVLWPVIGTLIMHLGYFRRHCWFNVPMKLGYGCVLEGGPQELKLQDLS
ncbi:MAG TPA: hypothetical protein DCW35_07985 [Polynucleobacter sp.]|nr:hypothetical protein [Polynucleobacter sp.]